MNKLNELIKRCKCGIYLEINEYRDCYKTVEEAIKNLNEFQEEEIDRELANRMIKENTIISLQFYPETPIGFYKVYGTSVEEVLKEALETLDEESKTKIK
ncbi:MAG: hypothetical protein H8D45_08090 [Bacteroidetes bacterium]|nr:hypothetical protein [Bacteroidota bacterium]